MSQNPNDERSKKVTNERRFEGFKEERFKESKADLTSNEQVVQVPSGPITRFLEHMVVD